MLHIYFEQLALFLAVIFFLKIQAQNESKCTVILYKQAFVHMNVLSYDGVLGLHLKKIIFVN